MSFTIINHDKPGHATNLLNFIDRPVHGRKPIKLFFFEGPNNPEPEYVNRVVKFNQNLDLVRETYNAMVKSGTSPANAKERTKRGYMATFANNPDISPENAEFRAELDVGLAIRGIRMFPIETFTKNEMRRMENDGAELRLQALRFNEMFGNFASIKELASARMEMETLVFRNKLWRDALIEKKIESKARLARKLFPETAQGESSGYLGLKHVNVALDSEKFSPAYAFGGLSVADSLAVRTKGRRPLTERECAIFTMGVNYFDPYVQDISARMGKPFAQEAFRNLMRAMPADIGEINRLTLNVRDHALRAGIVVNYFWNK